MEISKKEAKKLFPESPKWFREKLEEEFGADFFKQKKWESIKSFNDACKALGLNSNTILTAADTPDEAAYKKLKIIIKAINDGWEPDWGNSNQQKWWPWFLRSSGFGFDISYYDYGYSTTYVGSRLCFESKEKCDYAATTFISIYEDFLTTKK